MKKILVADDSVTTRTILKMLLSGQFAVTEAGNGAEAVAKAREESGFSIILMDVYMPVLDGFSAIREIRKLPGYSITPVIILTTDDSADVMKKGREAGATAFMTKPFDPELLVNTVLQLI